MHAPPLLLRPSPAQGTGSYDALPDFGADDALTCVRAQSRSRSPSRLRHEVSQTSLKLGRRVGTNGSAIDSESSRTSGEAYSSGTWRSKRRMSIGNTMIGDAPVPLDATEEDDDESVPLVEGQAQADPIDDSPYAQVRASVSPTDDTSLSINTPRMWTLCLLFSILGSSTNLFFSLRYPSVSITPVIALLLAHPVGRIWDIVFPETIAATSNSRWIRLRRWLGQGRWNMKEHACVYISSNVSFGFAFATDVIVSQTHFYHQPQPITYQILLTLSTQFLGYFFAGITRQWLVYPHSMIWPGTLMSTAMFSTLHESKEEEEVVKGWEKWGRWKFFTVVFGGSCVWYFVPGFLMPALSYFNVVTWFAPKNVVVANLFGVATGLGMFPLTFDWAQISYIGSPLMTPFWAAANVVAGLVIVMWMVAPILYYTNTFYGAYMPISSSSVYDNQGGFYDVLKVLTIDFLFDEEAYRKYSKIFLPITYVLSYGLQFAALTALVSHTVLWHGSDIWRQGRRALGLRVSTKEGYTAVTNDHSPNRILTEEEWIDAVGDTDIHLRLMSRYSEAPASWYLLVFLVTFLVGIFVVEYYPVHLPWYGLLLALTLCGVFFVPIGIVMAITNQQSSIFLICQLVCGTVFPGRPVANMVFVTYGYITSTQGLKFASDLKLGHYMKIPPRILFSVQMCATFVASLTQIGVLNWMFAYIPGICTPSALNGFTCPIARVHFNGSILWGVIGPHRFFGSGETYRPLIWAFAIGAVAPVPIWFYARNRPRRSLLRLVNLPVLFGSLSWIPPATGLNFSSWAVICYIFNNYIRRTNDGWWRKYTMTLSASLDSGLAVGLLVVFFGVVYPGWGWVEGFSWWGTEVYKQGCDWTACALKEVPKGGFGPEKW